MKSLRLAVVAAFLTAICNPAWCGAVLPPGGTNGQLQQNCNGSFCGISGVPVPPNAQTGATYTVQTTDWGALVTVNNAAGPAVTLPLSSSFSANFITTIQNVGSATATITTSGSDTLACPSGWGIQGNACTTIYLNQFDSVSLGSAGTSNSWTISYNPGRLDSPLRPQYATSKWYPPFYGFTPAVGVATNANYAICSPIIIQDWNVGLDGLAVTVTTTGTTGQTAEMALYTSHPTKGVPYKRISYINSFSIFGTAPFELDEFFSGGVVHVNPGTYWACIDISGSGAAFESAGTGVTPALFMSGATTQAQMIGANTYGGLWVANTYNASVGTTFPTDMSSLSWVPSYSSYTPFFAFYVYSVP